MTHNEDDELQGRLGYRFRDPELLIRALTHSSAIPELRAAAEASGGSSSGMQDNERLEFLGDAVLDLLASGDGSTKKEAEQKAARAALERLEHAGARD